MPVPDAAPWGKTGVLTAEEAFAFLDHASDVLARSLDYETTLSDVARLAVPELADWCAVDIVQPDGSFRQITSSHPDPQQEEVLMELRRRFRQATRGEAGVVRVVRTGEPELAEDVTGQTLHGFEIKSEEQQLYERL